MSGTILFQDVRFPGEGKPFSFSLSSGINRLLPSEKRERDVASFLFPAGTEGRLIANGKEYDLSRPGEARLFLLEARFQEGGSLFALLNVDGKEGARIAKELLSTEGLPFRDKVRGTLSLLKERGALYFLVEERRVELLALVRNLYPSFDGIPLLLLGKEEKGKAMPENRVLFRRGSFEREPFRKEVLLNRGEYLFQSFFLFLAVSLSIIGTRFLFLQKEALVAGVCLAVALLSLSVFLDSVRSSLVLLLKKGRGPTRVRRISLLSGLAGTAGSLLALLVAFLTDSLSLFDGFLEGFGEWSLFLSFLGVLFSFLFSILVSWSLLGRKRHG